MITLKRKAWILGTGLLFTLFSCEKEYSSENTDNNNTDQIVGINCRISKISYSDTSRGVFIGTGSLAANINNFDVVTKITKFDSLSGTIDYIADPIISGDTIYINADEYFIMDINKRILSLHTLIDPADPFSAQYDVSYFYDPNGYLISKFYALTSTPGIPFYIVTYTYSGGKLMHMERIDNLTGDLDMDADIDYYSNILPNRYIYVFPDEEKYPWFTQFYNFGQRPPNAIKNIKVRNYDPGNIVRDSAVSTFTHYELSRDNYVLNVQMHGDAQPSIPAAKGKLRFSYHCK